MRLNTILVAIVLFCFSCHKTHSYMVHGQIVDSTVIPNAPISNTSFVLTVMKNGPTISSPAQEIPYTFTTDNNGNFNVSFNVKGLDGFMLSYPSGTPIPIRNSDFALNKYDYDLGIVKTKKL